MNIISILNLNFLTIKDKKTDEILYGCDQEWFTTEWQRIAGCGTSVAANIIMYLNNKCHAAELLSDINDKDETLLLMDEIWKYVTPTNHGINTTKLFYEPFMTYIKSKDLEFKYKFMDLPADKMNRPELSEVLVFIKDALSQDAPIAFLNLNNGAEVNLDEWHWVTIISLEYDTEEKQAFIHIMDEGIIKKIDFALWYNTTTKDGGLVYFTE